MAVKRERDRKIPESVGSLHKSALHADVADGPALSAADDAFDQSARILIAHIERQGVAPAGPVKVEPGDGVKACAVCGRRQVALDLMQLADEFGRHRGQMSPKRAWDAPSFLRGRLIGIDATGGQIKSALKPLIQPPAAMNSAQRQTAFSDQRRQIFVAAIFVPAHPTAPAAQAFADAGGYVIPVILLAVLQPQLGAQRGISPNPFAPPRAKPVAGDSDECPRAPSCVKAGAPRPGEHLGQRLLQSRYFVRGEAICVKRASRRRRQPAVAKNLIKCDRQTSMNRANRS